MHRPIIVIDSAKEVLATLVKKDGKSKERGARDYTRSFLAFGKSQAVTKGRFSAEIKRAGAVNFQSFFPSTTCNNNAQTEEMFETTCTLPLSSELFAQAIHPNEPILAVGLSAGHVQAFRLPSISSISDDEDGNASVLSTGTATIDTEWRTRRHKGSCRTLAFSLDGESKFQSLERSKIENTWLTVTLSSPLLSWHRFPPESCIFIDWSSQCQARHT
jgi:hypothetical protein